MRTKKGIKRNLKPDPIYNDLLVAKFINHMMQKGKKVKSQGIFFKALDIIKEQTKGDPLHVFKRAIENASPYVEVISRRIGGATYQVPKEVRSERRISLAMRWIIEGSRHEKGEPMYVKLAAEFIAAEKNEGKAVKKKIEIQKIAEANKAFAHLAW